MRHSSVLPQPPRPRTPTDNGRVRKHLPRSRHESFLAGVVGGGAVVAAVVAAVAMSGGLDRSTNAVTVVEPAPDSAAGEVEPQHRPTAQQLYTRAAAGVVFINSTGMRAAQSPSEYVKGEGGQQGTATGSGFEIDKAGHILTNWHVVASGANVTVSLSEHGQPIEARVVTQDPSHDLALLEIPTDGLTLHPLSLGDSRAVQVGEPVLAIGNPLGYARTLTSGIISGLDRDIQAPTGGRITGALQTDAPMNPGSSGGPLLNAEGQVIGLNSEIVTAGSGGGDVGIAFAIPIDLAKKDIAGLRRPLGG